MGAPQSLRAYFLRIGRKGGVRSRRALSSADARNMVRVREARRAFRDFHAQCSGTCAAIWRSRSTISRRSSADYGGTAAARDSLSRRDWQPVMKTGLSPGPRRDRQGARLTRSAHAVEHHSGRRPAAHRRQPQPRQLMSRERPCSTARTRRRAIRSISIFFHDLEDGVAQSAETDAATLRAAGA